MVGIMFFFRSSYQAVMKVKKYQQHKIGEESYLKLKVAIKLLSDLTGFGQTNNDSNHGIFLWEYHQQIFFHHQNLKKNKNEYTRNIIETTN